jgi:hypothetical protein
MTKIQVLYSTKAPAKKLKKKKRKAQNVCNKCEKLKILLHL